MTDKVKLGAGRAPRNNKKEVTETRPERIPVSGQRDVLTVRGKDPAYAYRWVIDKDERGQRIMKFRDAGYEFVDISDGVSVGQNHVYTSENVGTLIRIPDGQEGDFLYLMKQRKEFYEEDQAAKQEQILDTERQLTRTESGEGGQYGKVSINN